MAFYIGAEEAALLWLGKLPVGGWEQQTLKERKDKRVERQAIKLVFRSNNLNVHVNTLVKSTFYACTM